MKKIIIFFICCITLFIGGCVNEVEFDNQPSKDTITIYDNEETLTEEFIEGSEEQATEKETYTYIEREEIQSDIVYSFEKIYIPEDMSLESYFIYDNYIFYSVRSKEYDAWGWPVSMIYMVDTNTDESRLLYSESGMISDIQYNGRYLIWEKVSNEFHINIYVLDMENGTYDIVEHDFDLVYMVKKISEDYVFWIDPEWSTSEMIVYRYDLKTKNIVELIKSVSMRETFSIETSQEVITVINDTETGVNIAGYDFNGKQIYNYNTNDEVFEATCNSYGVVWTGCINEKFNVNFYDAKTQVVYDLGSAGSYVLLEDCIVLREELSGIYSYKIGSEKQKYIIKDTKNTTSVLKTDINGNIQCRWFEPMQILSEELILLKVSQSLKLN